MGVVYFLVDEDRAETFELGKGWDSWCVWRSLRSAAELCFLCERVVRSWGPGATSLGYAGRFAERLGAFLRGRSQGRLRVVDEDAYDFREPGEIGDGGGEQLPIVRVVGSRYDSDAESAHYRSLERVAEAAAAFRRAGSPPGLQDLALEAELAQRRGDLERACLLAEAVERAAGEEVQ